MDLYKKGIDEFKKQYPFVVLSEKEKSLVSLAYFHGYADSKIDTYKRKISK
ncbi:hypothetical protein [Bacillus sp. T33-2]|uniref:hypothetical protein n=1 Tax=Bacillus sp. T33-2 TaxID=2054168 RepID=UPI0015E14F8E|nr:hypothetical protein [Bacillus sp. T33-2]